MELTSVYPSDEALIDNLFLMIMWFIALILKLTGLKTLDVLDVIRQHPDLCLPLFLVNNSKMSAAELDSLFDFMFSAKGSNARPKEERVARTWAMFLEAAEGNYCSKPLTRESLSPRFDVIIPSRSAGEYTNAVRPSVRPSVRESVTQHCTPNMFSKM